MNMTSASRRGIAAALLGLVSSAAVADSRSFVDLSAGAGYSTNPLLRLGTDTDSGFARLSAYGYHDWSNPRGVTSVSAFVENNSYLTRYSNRQAFSLSANTNQRASETVTMFGGLSFSGDFGGQLGSRFYGAPQRSTAPDLSAPASSTIAGPLLPSDVLVIVDPSLFRVDEPIYRFGGNGGLAVTLSPRDSLSTSLGINRVWQKGGANFNSNNFDGSLGYSRQLSERVSAGVRFTGQYSDYALGRSVSSFGPQLTLSAQLSSQWRAAGAIGFVRSKVEGGTIGPSDSSTNLAVDGSICRQMRDDSFCLRAARSTQTGILGGAPTAITAGLDYFRRLSARDQIQLAVTAVRTGGQRLLGINQKTNYYSASANYDRSIGPRLSAGVNATARKLAAFGPDPKSDVGASVYLRYRLGDLR